MSSATLTAADARVMMQMSHAPQRAAMRRVIEQCERAIRLAASRNSIDTLFQVPLFLTDAPVYRLELMVGDLLAHLRSKGFVARRACDLMPERRDLANYIYINWTPLLTAHPTPGADTGKAPLSHRGRR